MKKIILLATVMLASICTVSAKVLEVESGSPSFVKEDASAIVEFNCENATWEGKENYKTWCGNLYAERNERALGHFIMGFNSKSKGLKLAKEAADAKYKLVFDVIEFDRFWAPLNKPGQCYGSVTGKLNVIDLQTNEIVCTIAVNKCNSIGTDFNITKNIGDCCLNLGYKLAKLKK